MAAAPDSLPEEHYQPLNQGFLKVSMTSRLGQVPVAFLPPMLHLSVLGIKADTKGGI